MTQNRLHQHPEPLAKFDGDTMASKRNSRIFTEESFAHEENWSAGQPAPQIPSYRSRRNSRSSGKEDFPAVAEKKGEVECAHIPSSGDLPVCLPNGTPTSVKNLPTQVEVIKAINAVHADSKVPQEDSEDFMSPPLAGRPHNFGVVLPGIYRSSYPKVQDFEYLQGLKLKTLVTLVKKDEIDEDLVSFAAANGIHQIIYNMKGTKKQSIPIETMKSILEVVLDRRNYPLMIHCNQGKHRTGCVVAVVRKIAGWNASSVLDEYRAFAEPKIRESDVEYIRNFAVSELHPLMIQSHPRYTPIQVRSFRRTLAFSTMIMLLWIVSGTQLVSTRNRLAGP